MKKIVSLILSLTFVFSSVCLTSCGKKDIDEPMSMKLGIGVHTDTVKSSAEEGKNGALEAVYTVAAVVLDSDNRIIKCKLDTIESSVAFTKDGKGVAGAEFKSKRELGDSYVMSDDQNKLKWYEQADAFAKLCEGKSIEEVKSLISSGGRGNQDVISAGCTITVSEFASAIEKSVSDLKPYSANKATDIKLKLKVSAKTTDATASANGKAELVGEFRAEALNGDKASFSSDKSEASSVSFNSSGVISE